MKVRSSQAPDLFEEPMLPAGFHYKTEVLSRAQEDALVRQFQILDFRPFELHGYLANRRIVSFGHRYDYAARTLRASDAMPAFLDPLLDTASEFSGIPPFAFQQALITEYAPGAGIGWHRDKPMFEDVVGLSFLTPCILRLRRRRGGGWERCAVLLAPRSAYLLRGAVREEWEHSITSMDRLRYSVTLRTFRD